MSKFVYSIIVGGLALAAILAVNFRIANAGEEIKTVQFSVLADDQANYGVDENYGTIPVVSASIIEDKMNDLESASSIPTIKYTTLPAETSEAASQENDEAQAAQKIKNQNKNRNREKDETKSQNGVSEEKKNEHKKTNENVPTDTPAVAENPGSSNTVTTGNVDNSGNQDNSQTKKDKASNQDSKPEKTK